MELSPKTRAITVRVSEHEFQALRKKADSLGMDLSSMIRMMAHADIEILIKLKEEEK